MNVKEFAERMYVGLSAGYWGDIDPDLFKYIAEGVDSFDVGDETVEAVESLQKILEDALNSAPVPAICTPMADKPLGEFEPTGKITARDVIAELRNAWKEFGKYTYEDKGADEVIDVRTMARRIKTEHDAAGIMNLLKEVAKVKDSHELISSIIGSYDNDEELFESLALIDGDFIGEHY